MLATAWGGAMHAAAKRKNRSSENKILWVVFVIPAIFFLLALPGIGEYYTAWAALGFTALWLPVMLVAIAAARYLIRTGADSESDDTAARAANPPGTEENSPSGETDPPAHQPPSPPPQPSSPYPPPPSPFQPPPPS